MKTYLEACTTDAERAELELVVKRYGLLTWLKRPVLDVLHHLDPNVGIVTIDAMGVSGDEIYCSELPPSVVGMLRRLPDDFRLNFRSMGNGKGGIRQVVSVGLADQDIFYTCLAAMRSNPDLFGSMENQWNVNWVSKMILQWSGHASTIVWSSHIHEWEAITKAARSIERVNYGPQLDAAYSLSRFFSHHYADQFVA